MAIDYEVVFFDAGGNSYATWVGKAGSLSPDIERVLGKRIKTYPFDDINEKTKYVSASTRLLSTINGRRPENIQWPDSL